MGEANGAAVRPSSSTANSTPRVGESRRRAGRLIGAAVAVTVLPRAFRERSHGDRRCGQGCEEIPPATRGASLRSVGDSRWRATDVPVSVAVSRVGAGVPVATGRRRVASHTSGPRVQLERSPEAIRLPNGAIKVEPRWVHRSERWIRRRKNRSRVHSGLNWPAQNCNASLRFVASARLSDGPSGMMYYSTHLGR